MVKVPCELPNGEATGRERTVLPDSAIDDAVTGKEFRSPCEFYAD